MNHLITTFLVCFLCFIASNSHSQENIPIQEWRVHLSFSETHDITLYPEGVIAAARDGIYIYGADGELNTLTTIDGIHASQITSVGYDYDEGSLYIGYESGVLDIVNGQHIFSLTSLSEDSRSAKAIHDFNIYNGKVYLATDIGILIYDPELHLFTSTYDGLGNNGEDIVINALEIFDGKIFAATNAGVISGPLQGYNLNDFRVWERYEHLPNTKAGDIIIFDGSLYTVLDGEGLYILDDNSWINTGLFQNSDFEDLSADGDVLYVTTTEKVFSLQNEQVNELAEDVVKSPVETISAENGTIYIADLKAGLIKVSDEKVEIIKPLGPQIPIINRLDVIDQGLYAFPGSLNNITSAEGFSIFREGVWKNYSNDQIETQFQIPHVSALYDVALFNGDRYFSSLEDGLFVIKDGEQQVLKAGDDGIPFQEFSNKTVITGLAETADGIWVVNYGAQNSLHFYDGQSWQSFDLQYDFVVDILVSPQGLLVLRLDTDMSGGILVFDPVTGQQRYLNDDIGMGEFPSDKIHDAVFDRNGYLWLATSSGIAYISSLNNVFSGDIKAIVPVFENRYLLRNVNATAIAFDGGNRMWVGSDQGVWLFNNDFNEEVYHFNEDNSPLLNNNIEDIILLQQTGEVFFATTHGLISFRTASSTPALARSNIKVFPNPVTPDYQGIVGISGTTADAVVKITDEAGNLIYETTSNGSTASWDLKNMNGHEVATGVYLIFTSAPDGSDDLIGKIAVVR